jgi:hypothetical protein
MFEKCRICKEQCIEGAYKDTYLLGSNEEPAYICSDCKPHYTKTCTLVGILENKVDNLIMKLLKRKSDD